MGSILLAIADAIKIRFANNANKIIYTVGIGIAVIIAIAVVGILHT